jgi:hypothetical protein
LLELRRIASQEQSGSCDEECVVSRIVIRSFARALFLAVVALPVAARAQKLPEPQPSAAAPLSVMARPLNIQIDPLLAPLVEKLLRQSPTVRRQWEAISANRLVRVSLISSPLLRESTAARARTGVSRYAFGAVRAVVELPSAADITELLAHELEHVLEQAEGLDLPTLAKDGSSGVQQLSRGVYETERARSAGFAAMREVYGETDRAFSTAVRGVQRALKALIPDGRVAADAASQPVAPQRQERRPAPAAVPAGAAKREGGGHPAHKQE